MLPNVDSPGPRKCRIDIEIDGSVDSLFAGSVGANKSRAQTANKSRAQIPNTRCRTNVAANGNTRNFEAVAKVFA
jgi:hypothetical protein